MNWYTKTWINEKVKVTGRGGGDLWETKRTVLAPTVARPTPPAAVSDLMAYDDVTILKLTMQWSQTKQARY